MTETELGFAQVVRLQTFEQLGGVQTDAANETLRVFGHVNLQVKSILDAFSEQWVGHSEDDV